jgi:hypothetical protein
MNETAQAKQKTCSIHIKPFTQWNNINILENLYVYKITNWLRMKDIPPGHNLVVHLISIARQPQDEGMSPQGDMALLVIHSPHLVAKKSSSTPVAVPIHQLPTICTTQ